MAEWSNAAVLKTVEGYTSGGSNPSFSAQRDLSSKRTRSLFYYTKLPDRPEIIKNTLAIFLTQNVYFFLSLRKPNG